MEIQVAKRIHVKYASIISETISSSAQVRGTGIARRTPEYIQKKIESGDAIIALDGETFAGFCYIEAWGHEKYVAHSGLIVAPVYRGIRLAKKIKTQIFAYTKEKYPNAKIFGITTGLQVMKINYDLGYKPVTFSQLTDDPSFWKGCQTCKNYDVLTRTNQTMCLCTGMLYDPAVKNSNGIVGRIQSFKKAFKREKK